MPDIPNIYLDDPDPLSVLLGRMALSAEVYVSGGFCGTWAVDTAGSRRIPFHLIGDGEAWLHFGDDLPVMLNAGDLVIFPGDAHHVIANSKTRPPPEKVNQPMTNDGAITHMVCGFFEFKSRISFPLLDTLPGIVRLSTSNGSQAKRLENLVRLILLELQEARPGSYAVVDQLAYLLFVEILRYQVEHGFLSDGLLVALFDPKIGKALAAIHHRPGDNWTLSSMSEIATMSRSGFTDQFTRTAGLSPIKYLTLFRMTEAQRLLTTTDLSTAQIAEKSGYETEAAFRKAFKNTLGITPGAARKEALAHETA